MGMLSPEELARLTSAESLFPSPIPVQSVSSDEFMPALQTPRQREFLRRTSVLECMSGPLCDAVLDRSGSGRELQSIEHSNLFIVPLDGHDEWFRYHHLFRDLLQRELAERDPGLIATLNRRAADWLEANGRPEEALHHAFASGSPTRAARTASASARGSSARARSTASRSAWPTSRTTTSRSPRGSARPSRPRSRSCRSCSRSRSSA